MPAKLQSANVICLIKTGSGTLFLKSFINHGTNFLRCQEIFLVHNHQRVFDAPSGQSGYLDPLWHLETFRGTAIRGNSFSMNQIRHAVRTREYILNRKSALIITRQPFSYPQQIRYRSTPMSKLTCTGSSHIKKVTPVL